MWVNTTLYPLPYAVFALVLYLLFSITLRIYFGLGATGGVKPSLSLEFISAAISRAWLPALSIIVLWQASWYLSTHLLTLTVKRENYYMYAVVRGLPPRTLFSRYLLRNVMLPQITALALSLGNIFSGAVATEYIFAYPGLGMLFLMALQRADYNLILGLAAFSITGIAMAAFILDVIYPLIDPRIRTGFAGR